MDNYDHSYVMQSIDFLLIGRVKVRLYIVVHNTFHNVYLSDWETKFDPNIFWFRNEIEEFFCTRINNY